MVPPLRLKVLESIAELSAAQWHALLGPSPLPFVRWEWLWALEASGSASAATGWAPRHLTLWRGERLVAGAPAYLKHHSLGEYIYDFAWAQAAQRRGVPYYPKLVLGAPLSPVTAPRLLVAEGEEKEPLRRLLVQAALALAQESGCSSVHVLYPPEEEAAAMEACGLFRRTTMQYHWHNVGYRSYDEFLSRFDAKRRHQLRRERAAAATQGLHLRTVRGAELGPAHARRAFQLYAATVAKHGWGRVQLNPGFFERAFASLGAEAFELVEAVRGDEVVAGAFNVTHGGRLFGRYWGCFEEHPFLHFHVCLYHSIDECIRLGRTAFEPGAGGEHKVARGFEPSPVYSLHRIFDAPLERAVRAAVRAEAQDLEPLFAASAETSGMRPWPARSAGPAP